jgi:DNA adenine methylase
MSKTFAKILECDNNEYILTETLSGFENSNVKSHFDKCKKDLFLQSLSNHKGKLKYKRYSCSTLRYAGGKSLAVGLIVELIPNDVKKIISPFFGGGSVEIACSSMLDIEVIGYDIFDILVNYWQVQINNKKELFDRLSKIEPSKENYEVIKSELKKHWQGQIKLDSLTLAVYYFFNHNLSYGPGFLGWMSSIYTNPKKYQSAINKIIEFNPKNLSVSCKSFDSALREHQQDFLYCDPPYYLGGDSKMFKGIYPQRNFPVHHNQFNHELLCQLLKNHKNGFILSYNDCPEIRNMYKDYKIIEVEWQYTMGQGETRIGKNRLAKGENHIKKSHEILITNL